MNFTKKPRLAILRNEDPFDYLFWVKACKYFNNKVRYEVIDLTKSDWLERIKKYNPDYCLLKPAGKTSLYHSLYQERIDILVHNLKVKVFPSYEELRIYENKRFFSYWAKANNIPHPQTYVYYSKKEALDFSEKCSLPIVGKLNIGASGNGIQIIHEKNELRSYIKEAFDIGLVAKTGPKLDKGRLIQRFWQKITHPKELYNRIKTYNAIASDKQKDFVILQEYVPHDFEWRVVRIGESYFAHKKLKLGEKTSGSLLKIYEAPPVKLLDFVKAITDIHKFYSQAVDIFESDGEFLVNEMQCIFGQSDPYQMKVNDKIGRYIWQNDSWIFEEGDYAKNACYNLRVEFIVNQLLNDSGSIR